MMKTILSTLFLFLLVQTSFAQDKYFTKTAKIDFFSKAPLEDITARTNTAAAILDTKSGSLQFSVVMKSFEFKKALMQEHFNENYVESGKYTKGEFRGSIANNSAVNYTKDGSYAVTVKGKMTIHGVTRDVEAPGTLRVDNGVVYANSTFNLLLSDYNIKIPAVVKDKVSNTIQITVDAKLDPLK
ncbi:MAG: YceI family protein [Flavisolibacter sp.]